MAMDLRKKYEQELSELTQEINWEVLDFLPNGHSIFADMVAQSRVRIVDLVSLMEDTDDPVARMLHERDLIHNLAIDEVGERYESIMQLLEEV
jgi:hypothetical protein